MQNAQHAIPFYVTVISVKGGKLASFPHNGHTFQVHTNNEWLNQELSIQFRCHLKIPYKRANEKKKIHGKTPGMTTVRNCQDWIGGDCHWTWCFMRKHCIPKWLFIKQFKQITDLNTHQISGHLSKIVTW